MFNEFKFIHYSDSQVYAYCTADHCYELKEKSKLSTLLQASKTLKVDTSIYNYKPKYQIFKIVKCS